ncbi:MAG: cadmium-translocating P-type ATPase [Bosea sp.]|uniref:heavy metal translocating P-type ATPase n=1 Tax=Bosea sp. (in: a-proteobacteria) TaxID=1871050 RepID=UPI001ACF26BE|nr:heavy metal translocating P-type ATPase [Bosea sp. (in: a-proteobacteria)]MBN9453536.1 cadmium-translocating P-type ATPase [Bosea sp. (in: a-proteobacteria)]
MSCCAPPLALDGAPDPSAARQEIRLASRDLGNGLRQSDLSVPGLHCAACIRAVETGLARLPGVAQVRVNLSTRRVSVQWQGEDPPELLTALTGLGYPGHLFESEAAGTDPERDRLVRALAVAGFCAMNIMLLSVSVWSGAEPETRQAFHWISGALALPCLLYSGRIFFASAWTVLRRGRTNMDVPISIGICLAFALSLYDTIHDGPHAYFDAATSLIFFLLIGRTLDHLMHEKARAAVRGLMRLAPRGATVLDVDGERSYLPLAEVGPGRRIALTAGERVPVDGVVEDGTSELDCAIATGESLPQAVSPGIAVQAGTLNLSGPLTIRATAKAESSFLAEMVRLMEAAEGGRARYRRIADRAAALYSPVVHATALVAFLGWMLATGDWHRAITIAIAVLIITCPCALGLAVPIVQVVASRRLFEAGIMVKDGSAIERIAEVDTVAFDKTGTLTYGQPQLVDPESIPAGDLAIAAAIARRSGHPLSRAIAAAAPEEALGLREIREHPGLGIEAELEGHRYRLGRARWALAQAGGRQESGTVLSRDGALVASFAFVETLRPQARDAIDVLRADGLVIELLSGDRPEAVQPVASRLGIGDVSAGLLPTGKVERLEALAAEGRKVLMVGDGLNDAPALAAAHASMAPASAADIGRNAADFVFLHDGLDAVPVAVAVARAAGRLVRQNFALAILYNALALPVAIAGYVTPLIAALAMSLSSILVVANALRLDAGNAAVPAKSGPRPVKGLAAAHETGT